MSDHERGAYTPPTDAPLSFDPRQPARGARPIPFTLLLSVLVLAGLVAAIFVFYQQGVRKAGEAPRTIGTPVGEMKTAAPPDAQPQDPAAGLQVYRAEGGEPMQTLPQSPQFAPPPEQPQARPTTPVVTTPAPPPAAQAPQPTPPAPALRTTIPAAPPPAPKAATAQPAAKAPAPAQAAPKTTAAAPPPAKTPPPAASAPKPAAAPSGGGAVVQVGAVSSQALADKAWSDAVAAAPGLGAGKGKSVEKIDRNGATLFRTAVTGFASRADAQAFCDKLKAAGKSCFVR